MEFKFKNMSCIGNKGIVIKNYNEKFCYVLTIAGIYKGKNILKKCYLKKYTVCKIIYNDGNILIIEKAH